MSAGREWEDYDSWFRLRLENDLRLEEIEAEKISRFILSLFLNQENEIDYQREKDLFKYRKTRYGYFTGKFSRCRKYFSRFFEPNFIFISLARTVGQL